MRKLNAQNMTWIDTAELAAKDATIARLTREREAWLAACKQMVLATAASTLTLDNQYAEQGAAITACRAAIALVEGREV